MTDRETHRWSIRSPHWGWLLLLAIALACASVILGVWIRHSQVRAVFEEASAQGAWGDAVYGPEWLETLLEGHDRLKGWLATDVKFIEYEPENLKPTRPVDLSYLSGVDRVRRLKVYGDGLGSKDVQYLRHLSQLEDLALHDAPEISDSDLVHLSGLTQLRCLALSGTSVGDDGLRLLSEVGPLEILEISRTHVHRGLRFLDLREIRSLYANRTLIDDDGLEPLC